MVFLKQVLLGRPATTRQVAERIVARTFERNAMAEEGTTEVSIDQLHRLSQQVTPPDTEHQISAGWRFGAVVHGGLAAPLAKASRRLTWPPEGVAAVCVPGGGGVVSWGGRPLDGWWRGQGQPAESTGRVRIRLDHEPPDRWCMCGIYYAPRLHDLVDPFLPGYAQRLNRREGGPAVSRPRGGNLRIAEWPAAAAACFYEVEVWGRLAPSLLREVPSESRAQYARPRRGGRMYLFSAHARHAATLAAAYDMDIIIGATASAARWIDEVVKHETEASL